MIIEGSQPGGQLTLTTEVENYPGFADGILGPDMMEIFRKQAMRFGAELYLDDVTQVDLSAAAFRLWIGDTVIHAEALIIATGAATRWLGLASEARLRGYGVSSCATCDGFFFAAKRSWLQAVAMQPSRRLCFSPSLRRTSPCVHRRDQLRASKIMQERAFKHEKDQLHVGHGDRGRAR